MKILEIIDKYPAMNITIGAGELKEWAEYIVRLTRQELEQQATNVKNETYLSRDEVAEMLRVDKSTLWRWNRDNYLVHIEIGGKRVYRMSDVKLILGEDKNGNN